jgi:predicted O-methyltransferase YrrM
MDDKYEFTTDWFSKYWPNWLTLTADQRISKILEIGSFEGRSACTMIDHFSKTAPLELVCIDDWGGGADLAEFDMKVVEQRFNRNIQRAISGAPNPVKVQKCKGNSVEMLSALLINGCKNHFDLIFVDGSHEAPDVLSDLVMSYQLCAIGGLIICDDYLWSGVPHGSEDLLAMPRLAVDAFGRLFTRKVALWGDLPLYQAYFRKTA